MALFFLLLGKASLAYLPTARFVTLKSLFLFQQAQYAQVFPLKPALFCKLSAGLGCTNKSATFQELLAGSSRQEPSSLSLSVLSG